MIQISEKDARTLANIITMYPSTNKQAGKIIADLRLILKDITPREHRDIINLIDRLDPYCKVTHPDD